MISKRFFKQIAAYGIVAAMLLSISACGTDAGGGNDQTASQTTSAVSQVSETTTSAPAEPVIINYYCNATWTANQADPVSKELEKKTGVKLNVISGNADKLKVILASGDVYDLNLIEAPQMQNVLEGKLAMPLDDLIKSNGQNLEKYAGNALALYRKFKSNGENKQYLLPIRTGNPKAVAASSYNGGTTGLYLRTDYYKELGYPEIKNYDNMLKVLSDMQKAHPKTSDGKKVYGVSGWQDWGLWNFSVQFGFPAGMSNIDNIHEQTADNNISNTYTETDSVFWQAAEFYYKANKSGLLDPDFFINKYDNYVAKYKAGQLLTVAAGWCPPEAYAALAEKGEKYASFATVPMPESLQYNVATLSPSYTFGGGFALFIGKDSKVADKVMDFLNYTFSPEGSRLIFSGVKGMHWDVVDGKPQAKPEVIEQIKKDQNYKTNTGILLYDKLAGLEAGEINGEDGFVNDLFNYSPLVYVSKNNDGDKEFCQHFGITYPGELWTKYEKDGILKPVTRIDDIRGSMSGAPEDIKKIDSAMEEYMKKNITKVVLAKDDDAFKAAKEIIIAELIKLGAEKSDKWWKEAFDKTKADVIEMIK